MPTVTSSNGRNGNSEALGLVETKGLIATIAATDAMAKAANVTLAGQVQIGGAYVTTFVRGDVGSVRAAVRHCLRQLTDPRVQALKDAGELAAIGFKAIHARGLTGVHRVDDGVLSAMEDYADVAPAHNPPYVRAMRLLARELPQIPLVAAFETDFHKDIAPAQRLYAVPLEWATKHGIERCGFHGASHRYIAERTADLLNKPDAK